VYSPKKGSLLMELEYIGMKNSSFSRESIHRSISKLESYSTTF
jgi:hypothetical protein